MPFLMRNFENQRDNLRELTKYRKRIGNHHLLILDEWLNYKVTEKDEKLLYELFEQRSGNNPTIFVGQYPVDEWHDRLGGGTQADSIMDRVKKLEFKNSHYGRFSLFFSQKYIDNRRLSAYTCIINTLSVFRDKWRNNVWNL